MAIATATIALGASVSASFNSAHEAIVGIRAPQMEATTTTLFLQHSADVNDPDLTDATRTWVDVYDGNGNQVGIPVSASAARAVSLNAEWCMLYGRFRFVASTGSAAVTQTAAKSITVYTRRLR